MNNENLSKKDVEMMREFTDVLRARRDIDGTQYSATYALGYLESFVAAHMTPTLRKAVRERLDMINGEIA